MWCRCKKGSTREPFVEIWDKWGNPYRIKKGDQVVSLSGFKGSTLGVDFNYSTVTDLAKFLGMSTSHPLRTAR